jgi:hypothetical protein
MRNHTYTPTERKYRVWRRTARERIGVRGEEPRRAIEIYRKIPFTGAQGNIGAIGYPAA